MALAILNDPDIDEHSRARFQQVHDHLPPSANARMHQRLFVSDVGDGTRVITFPVRPRKMDVDRALELMAAAGVEHAIIVAPPGSNLEGALGGPSASRVFTQDPTQVDRLIEDAAPVLSTGMPARGVQEPIFAPTAAARPRANAPARRELEAMFRRTMIRTGEAVALGEHVLFPTPNGYYLAYEGRELNRTDVLNHARELANRAGLPLVIHAPGTLPNRADPSLCTRSEAELRTTPLVLDLIAAVRRHGETAGIARDERGFIPGTVATEYRVVFVSIEMSLNRSIEDALARARVFARDHIAQVHIVAPSLPLPPSMEQRSHSVDTFERQNFAQSRGTTYPVAEPYAPPEPVSQNGVDLHGAGLRAASTGASPGYGETFGGSGDGGERRRRRAQRSRRSGGAGATLP